MSKTLKTSIIFIIAISILFLCGNVVKAEGYGSSSNYQFYEFNGVLERGEEVNKRFVDHVEGIEYILDDCELPNGLSLSEDGRIIGTVDAEQEHELYEIQIVLMEGQEYKGHYYCEIKIINEAETEEWVDFNNLYMEETTIDESNSASPIYTKDGIVVYRDTSEKYVSYNPSTKTYNIVFSQSFEDETPGNYVEMLFKESEKDKLVKFEIVENEGFYSFEPYIISIADYEYTTDDDENLYSAYMMAQVNTTYTGTNRHLKIKATNIKDSSQYRYLNFKIIPSDKVFVVFETNGGSNINTIEKDRGDKLVIPSTIEREGWIFEGWYIDKEFKTPLDITVELTRSIALFADWQNDYKFIEGQGIQYDLVKGGNIKFKINAKLELLDKVLVDGTEIDSTNYKKESGSTIITLLEDYVKTLDEGKHTIKATYTDGNDAETEFSVIKAADEKDDTPKTGVENNIGYIALIGMVSLVAIAVIEKRV